MGTSSTKHGSSSLFVESLGRTFLLFGLLVCFSLGVLVTNTPVFSSSEAPTKYLSGHQWALARFGFPSAFHDSFYPSLEDLPCQPQRLHWTQASDVNGEGLVNMTLSFTAPLNDCEDIQATVLYGRGAFPEGSTSEGEVLQFKYDASLAVPNLTDYQSDWIHHMIIPRMQAGRQVYWYRILIHEREKDPSLQLRHPAPLMGETSAHTLMTPPMAHQPTALALVGDLGQTENSTKTMHHIYQATITDGVPVSGLVIAGDLSYADGDPRRWTSWMELMVRLFRS